MPQRLTRSQIPAEQTWNLADLFPTDSAWEEELHAVLADLNTVTQFKGRLGEGANVLRECLSARESLLERTARVTTFAELRSSADGTDPVNQANASKSGAMAANVDAALSFIDSEILRLPAGTVESYLEQDSGFGPYRGMLDSLLERRAFQLSPETEEVLASLGEVFSAPYTVYRRSKLSDMSFDPVTDAEGQQHPVSFALYEDHYELSPDTDLRRKANASFVKTLKQYTNTFAAAYSAQVTREVVMARQRKYKSVTAMLLHRQRVSEDMYNNLLDIIRQDLAPHMRRFAKLKQRELGLDRMRHCDLKVPLDPEFSPKTTFAEASDVIQDALAILGPEYSAIIKTALTERWVDLADNVGKSTGAFCSSPYGVHPYILITWTDSMRSAFVLAHELGHAGHFALAHRNQSLSNSRPSMYFIEAPSTMNEMLLGHHILKNSNDPRMRRWVITQFLNTYYHNYVTHLLEGELQRRVYGQAEAGVPITASLLTHLKGDVLTEFWGDAVDIDEGARLTWMRQPHYYMGLYPYTYSAGLTASTVVSEIIRTEGQPAVDRWLQVLKAGGTKSPLELMKMAGVDMSSPEPIRQAVAYVGTLIDELEQSFPVNP